MSTGHGGPQEADPFVFALLDALVHYRAREERVVVAMVLLTAPLGNGNAFAFERIRPTSIAHCRLLQLDEHQRPTDRA